MARVRSGLLPVAGGFSQMISAGRAKDATGTRGKRRQFRLKIAIDESYGPPQARRVLAVARLADITAMRDALVAVGRGAQAEFLMRKAGAVAGDEEKFAFAIAAANVVMSRPSDKASEASNRFSTWGLLARAWGSQELARLYPNAGYGKKSAEATDEPRIEYLCKYIENVPLASFNDDDYWRAMRPARERCKTDSTFKAYAQVCRRVLKIAVELRIISAWPLSAVCKLPIVAKGEAPEFPFLYPEEYCRLMRCALIPIQYRVLWGFILREGLRLGEAFRIRWEHLAQLPAQPGMPVRWVLNVPETKTGRALMFVLNAGTGEVLEAFRRVRPELAGPFVWLSATNLKKAADTLRRHVEQSGTTRERLLYTEGRLRRLREHDLRSTFVSWCKLAGIDNETIAQHTGHESNKMIARYNRSKATIEHLGLAPYLPLDQAMGLDVAGELGAPLVTAGGHGLPELAAGELQSTEIDESVNLGSESAPGPGRESLPPADLGGRRLDPASPCCPDCERPLARVQSGARAGWACVSCNAAGEAEGDWLEPVSSPLHGPAGSANAQLTAEGEPGAPPAPASAPATAQRRRAAPQGRPAGHVEVHARVSHGAQNTQKPAPAIDGAGSDFDSGYAPSGLLRARFVPGDNPANAVDKSDIPSGPGAPLTRRGCPECGMRAPVDREHAEWCSRAPFSTGAEALEPLNSCNPCDPGCDPGLAGAGSPAPQNEETSMFDAECARRDSNSHPVRGWNLNPAFGDRRKQTPGDQGGEGAPETTGTDRGSHPGVTPPATPLELLQATGLAYYAKRNWAALRALAPLIDAEVARVAEAARAAPPEPVRLEVVRAQRDRGQR